METKKIFISQPKAGIQYVTPNLKFKGRGGWYMCIDVEVVREIDEEDPEDTIIRYEDKVFSKYTTDSRMIDEISDCKDNQDMKALCTIYLDIVVDILQANDIEYKTVEMQNYYGRYNIEVTF